MRTAWALSCLALAGLGLSVAASPGQPIPQLRISSPRPGAVVSGFVPVSAEASEKLDLSFLVFGVDDDRPVAMNTRPFVFSWDTSAYRDGPHVLSVQAFGAGGAVTNASPVKVTVRNRPAAVLQPAPQPVSGNGPPALLLLPAPEPDAGRAVPVRRRISPRLPAPALACAAPSVVLAGRPLPLAVSLLGERAYLPVRPLAVQLRGTVTWHQSLRVVEARWAGRTVHLAINDPIAIVDGSQVRLSCPAILADDRTLVPARSCVPLLDLSVAWEAARRVIRMGWLPSCPLADTPYPES